MTRRILVAAALLALLIVPGAALPSAQMAAAGGAQVNKKDVVQKARDSYYNLKKRGLASFQSKVEPNWRYMLREEIEANPSGVEAGLQALMSLTFSWAVDPSGKVTVTHGAAPGGGSGYDQIFTGIEGTLTGFYETWSEFMVKSPFPDPAADFTLDEANGGYRLSFKDGESSIVMTMGKDYMISQREVTSSALKSVVKPRLAYTADGFVMTGYEREYTPTSGEGKVVVTDTAEYQMVNELRMPSRLRSSVIIDNGAPNETEIIFSGYQVKK